MRIEEIKKYLKQHKITYEKLSAMSKIPIGTLKSIFSGRTPNPRLDTVQAIEKALGLDSAWTQEERQDGVIDSIKRTVNAQQSELLDMFEDLTEEKKELLFKIIEAMLEDKN